MSRILATVATAVALATARAGDSPWPDPPPAPPFAPGCAECGPRCVRLPDVKKTTKVDYDGQRVEYCSPRWQLFDWCRGLWPHGCDCGAPHTKSVLLKFTRTVEEPTTKCVPACVVTPVK